MRRVGQRVGVAGRSPRWVRPLDVVIALAGLVALALWVAGARAPRSVAAVMPAAVASDGGHAFVFSPGFAPRWPYAAPSHPDDALAPGDAAVLEDGRPIGALDPAHAHIRERGGGLLNLWNGSLWFSPSDGTDPRTNGRSYKLIVRDRLAPSAVAILRWSLAAFATLLVLRIAIAMPLRALARGSRRLALGASAVGVAGGRRIRSSARQLRTLADLVPLTFGRSYAIVTAATLLGFAWQAWRRPALLFTQSDSFSYIVPGLIWASGRDTAGQSLRDFGYPLLTLSAVKLGSMAVLPRLQLVLAVLAMACLLGTLYIAFSLASSRLTALAGIPRWLSAAFASAAGAGFVAMLAAHDLFMIDIGSLMAEAPHAAPTALAALLFVGAWVARCPRRCFAFLISAALSAYVSAMFKPSTLLVTVAAAFCALSVVVRHRRALWTPSLSIYTAAVLAAALIVNRVDDRILSKGSDFGSKVLFCNRLDVIRPVFDASTPERLEVARMMRVAMAEVNGWPLMGYSGDMCIYDLSFTDAILAASRAENLTPAQWETREALHGMLFNPLRYLGDIWRQAAHFFAQPIEYVDLSAHSDLSADQELSLAPYAALMAVPRAAWSVDAVNWVPVAFPAPAGWAKLGLRKVARSFAAVTLSATVLAVVVLAGFGRRVDRRLEKAVAALALFTTAFIGTILLSHSFDVGRYTTDILPISLTWWFVSAAYLVQLGAAIIALPFRERRSRADGGRPGSRPFP